MSWFQPLLGVVQSLDKAVDRGAELFHQHVTPVVQDAAGQLDAWLEGSGQDVTKDLRRRAIVLDGRYQRFMIQRIDPLFGQARNDQLEEMGGFDISPQEVSLNRRIAFCALAIVAVVGGGALYPPSLIVTVPASFTMWLPIYGMAYASVKAQRRVTYHVVTAINVTAIWLSGLHVPALVNTLFFFLGEKLMMITQDRSQKGLIAVFSKQPRTVWLVRDGVEVERPFEEVLPGDVVVVGAGGAMSVDGTVVDGLASIDQQMLTGEAQPVEKAVGDPVYASTLVLAGKVHVRVDKAGNETVAAKIGEILNRTASYQLALQSRGSKMAHDGALPTLALSGLALVTLGAGSALATLNSGFGVTVRLSAPITMLNLFNIASHNGILLKDGRSLELLSEVDTVLFDKTGTLTIAQPNVAKVHSIGSFSEDHLLTFAAAAEHRQTHPIALAIVAEAQARGLALPDIENARYEVGYGIKVELGAPGTKKRAPRSKAQVEPETQTIQVGSDRFMHLEKIDVPPEIEELRAECHTRGHSLIMVAVDGRLAGAIELQPTIRLEAAEVIQTLHERGLKTVIISGDQEEPTRRLAAQLGIERYFANVLPEGKASLVEQLQAEGRAVCFVGDGINDAIALKKANVSISLRGATTAATDAAQVVLMQESLRQLPFLFELGADMERSLKAGNAAGMIPGVINVAGVFLLGWGIYHAVALNVAGMAVALGIAMYPGYKHKKTLAQAGAPQNVAAGAPQIPPHEGAAALPLPPASALPST